MNRRGRVQRGILIPVLAVLFEGLEDHKGHLDIHPHHRQL